MDYRRLREVDSTLLDSYVVPALRENGNLAPHVDALLTPADPAEDAPDGLDPAGLHGAFTTAIENKQRDSRRLDDLTAPMVHLRETTRSLDKAISAYTEVRQRGGFDRAAFALAVQEYQRAAAEFLTAAGFDGVTPPAGSGTGISDDLQGAGG
ncbi:MAG: hypothetical protein LC799_22370 [Actinobacteria bacterium]|nr:hypothetical protein [Actinomycetota bacterium]